MYLTTFVSLLVLSAALNCPLSQDQRSTAFSGIPCAYPGSLAAEPDSNYLAQDMRYTHNFGSALAQPPQVCLCTSCIQYRSFRLRGPEQGIHGNLFKNIISEPAELCGPRYFPRGQQMEQTGHSLPRLHQTGNLDRPGVRGPTPLR